MNAASWLQISLTVDGELAEAVAEVMARYAPNGVVIEQAGIDKFPDEIQTASGPLRVFCYLPADETLEETRQKLIEALWHLGQIQPLPEPEFKTIQETNWMEAWKEHYRPIPLGRRLLILPAWLKNPQPERLPVRIQPGMAFGTGAHPTTQLSLELLEEHLQPGQDVIDVGCGSGILSIAALRLGAARVLGVDVDEEATAWARENAALNEVERKIEFGLGSVAAVKAGRFGLTKAPLVVANILTHILIQLLDDGLGELLTPDGVLILSGILAEKEDEMLAALDHHGLEVIELRQREDWLGLVSRRAGEDV